jgi:formylglycine-generating enzyme required for sulfatase activity
MSSRIIFSLWFVAALPETTAVNAQPPKPKEGPLGMKFVPLPKGTFFMGGGKDLDKGKKTEIAADFEIGVYTVTQEQWQAIMGNNPSWFSRTGEGKNAVTKISDADLKQFPVEEVSWDDVQDFIKKLNEKERGNGWTYRLPTSAEWEYACRGGATSLEECSFHFYFAKPTNEATTEQVNFNPLESLTVRKDKFLERTAKVGSYPANKLGLYDMHGNVTQWCQDSQGEGEAKGRVFRGGGWRRGEARCWASAYSWIASSDRDNDRGFRLVRIPSGSK